MDSWWNDPRYFSIRNSFVAAFILVALSSVLRIWPLQMLGSNLAYLTYYPTVIVVAAIGGFSAGMLATTLVCLTITFLWSLIVSEPFIKFPADWLGMVVFVFNCTLISGLAEVMRRAHVHATNVRKELEFSLNATRLLTDRFNALLEATPDCLIISDKEGTITFANDVTETIFGYTPNELVGQKIEFLIPARHLTQHINHRQHYFENPHLRPMGVGLDLHGKHKDGHEFSVEISLSPIETADGLFVLSAVRDITERKKTEDAKAMLLALVESSDEAIIGKDLKGTIFSWNKAAEGLYGYTEAEMMGCCIKKLFSKDMQEEFNSIIQQIIHGEHIKHKESLRVHKDGHIIPVSVTISPIKNAQGKVIGASTTARDITQQKLFEEKLKHLAEHDALTGLINQPLFEDRLAQAISLTKRQKSNIAVCFLDLDGFKDINDVYGHAVGDLLLCAATARMQKYLRNVDTLARLGGDEFGLILMEVRKEQDVITVVKKLIDGFSRGFPIENKKLIVTASIGIALYPKDGDQSLIEKADAAMYYVKKHGKNNFKFYDEILMDLSPIKQS